MKLSINTFLPLQIIKNIPNDDLNEIYMKSRVLSYIGWSLAFVLLSFILVQFGGVDKLQSLYISLGVGTAYFLLRIAMASEEANKLLSEEVAMKLRKVDGIKVIEQEYSLKVEALQKELDTKESMLEQAQTWIDDFNKKVDALEAKCKSLEAKNTNQISVIEERDARIKELENDLARMKEEAGVEKKAIYEMAVAHTNELKTIKKSLAQNPGDEKRKTIEERLEEIEKEREEALGV